MNAKQDSDAEAARFEEAVLREHLLAPSLEELRFADVVTAARTPHTSSGQLRGAVLDVVELIRHARLEARKREGAARTVYQSVLSSLRFLEEAGEVPTAQLLHKHLALLSAGKEATAASAREQAKDILFFSILQ